MTANRPKFSPEELNHSRPVRWDREASSQKAHGLIEFLLFQLESWEHHQGLRKRKRRPADQARLMASLMAITLDLIASYFDDATRFLTVSRDRNSYVRPSRYRNPDITYAAVEAILAFFSKTGLVILVPGYFRRGLYEGMGQDGRRTRIRATAILMQMVNSHQIALNDITFRSNTEVIRLKGAPRGYGKTKPLIEYEDTAETNAMRERLNRVNALLANTEVTLSNPISTFPDDKDEMQPETGDHSLKRLYRVFNDGSFKRGGRFYGGWWQGLSHAQRQQLRVDGETVVELDFGAMHPRLCYELSGRPLSSNQDPYLIEGMEGQRNLVKRAFNQLLNSAGGSIRMPSGLLHQLPRGLSWKRLITILEDQHQSIFHWFRKGRGIELQAIDAAIADSIIYALALRNVPCLPVHDSFLVSTRFEGILGETMILAYQGQLGKLGVKRAKPVIKGWSSPNIEARLISQMSSIEVHH